MDFHGVLWPCGLEPPKSCELSRKFATPTVSKTHGGQACHKCPAPEPCCSAPRMLKPEHLQEVRVAGLTLHGVVFDILEESKHELLARACLCCQCMAVSTNWGVRSMGVLIKLFGVYIRATDFWKLPNLQETATTGL